MIESKVEEVISSILIELDNEQSQYQRLYRKNYGKIDEQSRHNYNEKVKLCERIRKELLTPERH